LHFCLPAITATTVFGQEPASRPTLDRDAFTVLDQDVNLLRKGRSLKEQIVAVSIDLTNDEAVKFWPAYDDYAAELTTGDAPGATFRRAAPWGPVSSCRREGILSGDHIHLLARQILDTIQQVHARKKCIPADIAARPAEHDGGIIHL
jgi:hypothetical protein